MKPALLLIDLQNDFLSAPSLVPAFGTIVDKSAQLLEQCRSVGIPVIHVWTTASLNNRMPHWQKLDKLICAEGTEGHATPVALKPLPAETIIHKTFFSSFSNDSLLPSLKKSGVDTLLMAGVHLHGCVRSTVLDAYQNGFVSLVASDAVASDDPLHSATTARYLEDRAASFISTDALCRLLSGEGTKTLQHAGAASLNSATAAVGDRKGGAKAPHSEKEPPIEIGGLHTKSLSEQIVHFSPRQTDHELWRMPYTSRNQLDEMTADSRAALKPWARVSQEKRFAILRRIGQLVGENSEVLSLMMAEDVGKPLSYGREEVARTVTLMDAIGARLSDYAEYRCGDGINVRYRPLGTVAIITPWNNPVAIPLGKIGPALFYGNKEQPTDKQVQPGDGSRPPGADNPQPYQGKPLFNPALTPEERIKEADRMYKNGERTVTGPDGKVYQISEVKVGNRTLVGVFGQDERGRPVPILRGIVEQDGKVSQQRDSKGKPVDIVSDYGKKNPDSPLVKHEKPPERNERPPRQEDPANEKPSDKVKRLAEKLEPPEDRQKFLTDMQKFEERAKRDNIPQEEVDKTYREMARLMEAQEGKVPAADRQLLAKNLMYHLADPTNIDQGQHNTCNVTTIAERMATRNPSKFVEMATTTALTGQWTAPDGKVIKIDPGSLIPGGEENRHPPVDGARSFATQLLNLTMVNDIKQREMPPKFYRQERPSGSNQDTGERLYYENGQKADGRVPGVDINQMTDFLKRTTGDTGVLVVDKEHATPDMVSINSPEELAAKLKQMQAEGKMPPILLIDANDKLFFNGPADKRNWHVVSITGYDERTGMVTISNQWGKPQDRQIPLADLYRAMNPGRPQPPTRPRTN